MIRTLACVAVLLTTSPALACGVQGNATRTDGSKVDGTATVSSSWNSTKAYPRGGFYSLDLGSGACGQRVTVYVNGQELGQVRLPNSGNVRADFVLKGTSDSLAR